METLEIILKELEQGKTSADNAEVRILDLFNGKKCKFCNNVIKNGRNDFCSDSCVDEYYAANR